MDEVLGFPKDAVAGVEIPFAFEIQNARVGDRTVVARCFAAPSHDVAAVLPARNSGDGEGVTVGFIVMNFFHDDISPSLILRFLSMENANFLLNSEQNRFFTEASLGVDAAFLTLIISLSIKKCNTMIEDRSMSDRRLRRAKP